MDRQIVGEIDGEIDCWTDGQTDRISRAERLIENKREKDIFQYQKNNNYNKQDKFTSRTRNLLFYGLEGGKDLLIQKWRHLMEVKSIFLSLEPFFSRNGGT